MKPIYFSYVEECFLWLKNQVGFVKPVIAKYRTKGSQVKNIILSSA